MWCHKCHADVAAITSSDNERLFCTSCDSELARPVGAVLPEKPAASVPEPTRRDPRELLARWAREDTLESLDVRAPLARDSSTTRKSVLRFDGTHSVLSSPPATFVERATGISPEPTPPAPPVPMSQPVSLEAIVHHAHAPSPPHYQSAPVSLADKSSRWVTLAGQLFAYLGVGALTIGTVLVLMGYFGGPASYATTGWLITTAG